MSDVATIRLEVEVETLRAENAKLKQERDKAIAESRKARAESHLSAAARDARVNPDAMSDLLRRAEDAGWTTNDKGQPVMGDDPFMTPDVWITDLKQKKSSRHLFLNEHTETGTSQTGGPNPWADATWNETEQGKVYRSDPARAAALAKAAGCKVADLPPSMRKKTPY